MTDASPWNDDEIDADDDDMEYEPMEPLLLTAEAAADLLCISTKTLSRLVRRDRIRCIEIVAAGFRRPIRRFRLADLQAFIDSSLS
jgi:hypothetical protein